MSELLDPQNVLRAVELLRGIELPWVELEEEADPALDHLVELLRSHRPAATAPTQEIDQTRTEHRNVAPAALPAAGAPRQEIGFGECTIMR